MTISLLPHQEKALQAALNAGVIGSVEEFVDSALAQLPDPHPRAQPELEAMTLVELCEPLRGLFEEGELDFSRNPSVLGVTVLNPWDLE